MKLNLEQLNQLQQQLDQHILDNHQLTRIETTQRRILALLVELAESANETRCFKFWSLKSSSDLSVIEEELSDVLHFIISLNLNLENPLTSIELTVTTQELTPLFLQTFHQALRLSEELNQENIAQVLNSFFNLVLSIGSSPQALLQAYVEKNEINHQRQEQQY
ncbi:MAG TPA: dUTPase [Erysipelothrix sp.]|nr:dUTPase [Erysipelothrix sp.]